ncbi:hypothetical protein LEP1GSC059_1343 [Leptospira noguchii serovar Panama str. CZ214]|uniref:Uncharacterized protein n=1 Tax=Leptospira noguchii serovar Panama str. CZ214 TaxID=1001595 RepID=T0FH67_9LEPT|nr:hypothetical protein LEP1GSC059_1343 [Leptospira noguchii serovar Panama str. CZ214]
MSYLDAAFVADHTLVTDGLEFTAVTFPVLCGPENFLAEKTVFLGL